MTVPLTSSCNATLISQLTIPALIDGYRIAAIPLPIPLPLTHTLLYPIQFDTYLSLNGSLLSGGYAQSLVSSPSPILQTATGFP